MEEERKNRRKGIVDNHIERLKIDLSIERLLYDSQISEMYVVLLNRVSMRALHPHDKHEVTAAYFGHLMQIGYINGINKIIDCIEEIGIEMGSQSEVPEEYKLMITILTEKFRSELKYKS